MELTLVSLIQALGGWDIVLRAGSVVALASLFQVAINHTKKGKLNGLVKRGTSFIASAVVAVLWSSSNEAIGRDLMVNFFFATVLWSVALKPMLRKLIDPGQTEREA